MYSFIFTGDFAPCRNYESMLLNKGDKIFGSLKNEISRADLAFVNLETPLCINGKPINKIGPNLKAHPDCAKALFDAGFGVIGLANNHIMDFGTEGLYETIQACQNLGLAICGAGSNLIEAQKPLIVDRKGIKSAFIAIAEHEFSIAEIKKAGVAPLDPIDNIMQIETARKQADFVFVTIHGGNEYFPYPRPGLRKLCRFLIERGADGVICHHPHVPGAYEFYQDKPIFYSLGNLIFNRINSSKDWEVGYALRLEYNTNLKKLIAYEIIPYTQSIDQCGLQKMQGASKVTLLERLADYNRILTDSSAYAQAWENFCDIRKRDMLMNNYFPINIRGVNKLNKFINPAKLFLTTEKTRGVKLNILRCESHHELLQSIVKKEFDLKNKI